MNPKQMQKMMKQMGMKQKDVDAEQVIVVQADGSRLVFDNPSLQEVEMMGQKTYQLTGTARLERAETTPDISDEDVQTVVEQTGATEDAARKAIEDADGDLAEAIMTLSE